MSKYLPWKVEIAGAKAPDKNRKQYNPTQHQLDCSKASGLFHRIFNWKRENELMEWANRPTEIEDYPEAFIDLGVYWDDVAHVNRVQWIFHNWALGSNLSDIERNTKPQYKSSADIIRICIKILDFDVIKVGCIHRVKAQSIVNNISIDIDQLIENKDYYERDHVSQRLKALAAEIEDLKKHLRALEG
tara:strand:- start:1686 stop:2249 length:564 start_codon:yes stop_codon:yes gene_type:complete